MRVRAERRRGLVVILVLAGLAGVATLMSLLFGAGTGSDRVGPVRSLAWLLGADDPRAELVVGHLRMGRTATGLVVGPAVGIAGCLLRTATRNLLAEPGILGVNAGAALGIVVGITYWGVEGLSAQARWGLGGALGAAAVVLALATTGRTAMSPLRLVLLGVALSATLKGATSFVLLHHAATYDQFRFWTLGSLSGREVGMLTPILPPVVVGLVATVALARPLASLALGDDVSAGLGNRPALVRAGVAVAVALLMGPSVALAGPLAFLGLVASLGARAVVGVSLGRELWASALLGAGVLVAADIASRLVIRPFELPVGVVLALVGSPVLVAVARRRDPVAGG